MTQNKMHCLILAGGQSRRMGQDKAEMIIDGQTLLARTASVVSGMVEQVYVSVRDARNVTGARAEFAVIADGQDGEGPLAGILAALESAPDADWLVLACDLPRVDAPTISALLEAADEDRRSPAIAMRSEHDGLPEPMCAVWRQPMAANIRDAFANNRFCARKCLILAEARLLESVTPGALTNMNSPADFDEVVAAANVSAHG